MTPYYERDGIVIYHGDCREILPTLASVDLVLTDPPYGIGFAAQPTTGQRKREQPRETWDAAPIAGLCGLLSLGKAQVVWGGNYYSLPLSRGWLAWVKPDAPPSMGNVELAWTNLDQNTRYFWQSIAATNPERVGHPTQKPVALMRWAIESTAPNAAAILDPFMGSGTTLRAAKDLGRKAIGIELEERYCEIAAKRLSQEVLL
jgi:site-specific DNA-methyltransferase (adenine-specific)